MMMLLPLLAMMTQTYQPPHECRVERKTRGAGEFYASRVFPGEDRVSQSWRYKRGQAAIDIYWNSALPASPDDAARVQIQFSEVSRDADKARIEFWRDGKRISERTGDWNDFNGHGYRDLGFEVSIGELRALAATGPIQIVAADGDGEMVAQVPLSLALIQQPGVLARSAQDDFATMAADYASRCPIQPDQEIVVT
jgi:hypothetical protein